MKLILHAAIAVGLAGCISMPQEEEPPPPPAGPCDPQGVQALTGQPFDEMLRAEMLPRSGARTLRVIRPGDVVTMDFRGDRLNVHLTGDGRIERFACG
jgi:hypothetical protein